MCSNGILQHKCVLELYIAARVCTQIVYCSTGACSNCILQHGCVLKSYIAARVCVLKWYTVARVCAQTGHCSTSVCANGILHSNNFGLKQHVLLLLKPFATIALEYKAILKFKNNLYALLRIP